LRLNLEKDPNYFQTSAKHLNDIFVKTEILEDSNIPKTIKHKRRKLVQKVKTESLSSSSSSSSNENSTQSSDDESDIIFVKKKSNSEPVTVKVIKTKYNLIEDSKEDRTDGKKKFIHNQENSKNPKTKIFDEHSSGTKRKQKDIELKTQNQKTFSINKIIPDFTSHIPNWGGYFSYQGKKITVTNTCTIDSCLLSLWVMNKIIPAFIQKLPQLEETKIIEEIIDYIERKDWNSARQNWYSKIMKNDLTNINLVDFYGEIQEYFMKYIYNFQTHSLI